MEAISVQLPVFIKVRNDQRLDCIKQLYALYLSQPEETRKENRKRYHQWVRLHYPEVCRKNGFSKEKYDSYKDEFRTAKLPKELRYLKPLNEKLFALRFSHLKGEDGIDTMRYMISVAKEKLHRGEKVGAYILGSLKVVEKPLA